MIPANHAGVKAAPVRTLADPPRQIQFAFRADPVALDDLRLPRTARAVFGLVLDNARHRGGRSRLSNGTMARILGCCTMTVKRALATLEAAQLVRRETTAEGRIRTGIVVTWEGVEHRCSTERMALEHPRSRGGTSPFQGVEHRCSTNQSPIQSEISDADRSSLRGEEDAEAAALFAELGPAAYLRAMIAKGREAAGKPAPSPAPAEPARAPQHEPTPPALPKAAPVADRPATSQPAASPATIANAAQQQPANARSESTSFSPGKAPGTIAANLHTRHGFRQMDTVPLSALTVPASDVMAAVRRMVGGLAEGLKAEEVGRRRVGPKLLAAQLAEVRRRHPGGRPR